MQIDEFKVNEPEPEPEPESESESDGKAEAPAFEVVYKSARTVFTVVLLLAIFSFTLPSFFQPQQKNEEITAIANLRAVVAAQTSFRAANDRFAINFDELTSPPEGQAFLDGNWTQPKQDYVFSWEETESGYTATAIPVDAITGIYRSFYVDQTGIMRCARGLPTASSTSQSLEAWKERPFWQFWR